MRAWHLPQVRRAGRPARGRDPRREAGRRRPQPGSARSSRRGGRRPPSGGARGRSGDRRPPTAEASCRARPRRERPTRCGESDGAEALEAFLAPSGRPRLVRAHAARVSNGDHPVARLAGRAPRRLAQPAAAADPRLPRRAGRARPGQRSISSRAGGAALLLPLRAPRGHGAAAIRGRRRSRRACRGACRRCWTCRTWSGSSTRRTWLTANGAHSRCATSPSSRPRTPPGCASASWPRPAGRPRHRPRRAARHRARAARSASRCSAALRARRSTPTCATAAAAAARGPAAPRMIRASSSSTRRAVRSACAACAIGSIGCRARRRARGIVAAHAPPLVRQPPARGRRRPARRAGAARPREPGHDPDLHPRNARRDCAARMRRRTRAPSGTPRHPRSRDRRLGPAGARRSDRRRGLLPLAHPRLGAHRGDHQPFRAGTELDAYFAAFRLPDAIFQLVAAGALSSAMIPVLAGLFTRDEEDRAWRVVSTVLNIMLRRAQRAGGDRRHLRAPDRAPDRHPGFDAARHGADRSS